MKILIVEDDRSSLIYLQKALTAKGYDVDTATNGIEALKKIEEESRPDLIISDILMPEMDGFELCKSLKTDDRYKNIPFVFYSATYIEKKDEQLALSLGASRFLIKPMEPDKFFQAIKEVLDNHESSNLPIYNGTVENIEKLNKMQIQALTKKLSKKVEELKKERETLQQNEYKYRRLYESLMDGFVMTDIHGNIRDFNKTYKSITGFTEYELQKMNYKDLTPVKWHALEEKIIQEQVLQRGFSDVYEKEYIRKDGKIIPVELHIFLLKDKNGNNEGMWAIVRDISEKKRIETENKKLQEQLLHSQKLEAIGHLAGGIAHEFNNLLHAIIGYATLIDIKMDKDDPLRRHLKDLIECTNRGSSLTQQILSFSRKQSFNMKSIDLNEKIKEVEKLISKIILQNMSLIYELSEEKLTVLADKSQIDQILINLVINARDAMPDGGNIRIKTDKVIIDKKEVSQEDLIPGEYALLSVQDTGVGIREDILDKIFEPFFTTKAVGLGTGLGLSVVYGIVKQHNGFIKVDSKEGLGTSFFIYLPLIKDEVKEISDEPKEELKGGSETILIAEDDDHVRGFLETFLKHYGYKIISTKDGHEALKRFEEAKDNIEICIFDLKMPTMNGRETIYEIKKIKPDCKTILISGYPGQIAKDRIINNILSKPINPEELLKTIRMLLDN